MILTDKEKQCIQHFSNGRQSVVFVGLLKKIVASYADVRNLKDCSAETVKGTQIACEIIEKEIIQRLELNKDNLITEITEEYE